MSKPFYLILLVSGLLTCHLSNSQQKLSIENVYSVTLRNAGVIMEGQQVKGYYFFYQSDKIDKYTNEYTLQIIDQNLNKVRDIKFNDGKDIILMESSYNGNAIMFMFYDIEQKMLDFRIYGMDGNKKAAYSKELDPRTERWLVNYRSQSLNDENQNQNIYDIKNRGFISVVPTWEAEQTSFEISFYFSTNRKTWTYTHSDDAKWAEAQYLGTNDSLIIFEVMKKESTKQFFTQLNYSDNKMTGNIQSWLLGLNISNGRKAFEIPLSSQGKKLYAMNISCLKSKAEFLVTGPYYDSLDKVLRSKTQGIGIWELNNKGKIVKQKYNSWTTDVGRYLKTDSKGRIEDLGYVYFHDMVQTSDGKIFAIGEGYSRDAVGSDKNSTRVNTGGGPLGSTLTITDMVLIQFDSSDFGVSNATIYPKNHNSCVMPSGALMVSPHMLAMTAKREGGFDYNYTQPGKNNNGFIVCYTDNVKEADMKGQTFNAISYFDGNFTTDRINLKTSSSKMKVLPAKDGYVMLVEFFKREKRIDIRLEKIN